VVRGHASAAESRDGALSEARSRAVRDYLVRQGVAPSRVVAVGMGSRFPVASERTAEGRQRNRRAEIEVRSDRGHDLARLW
jgi:outer membrane protein OmpA-like peptidoglycan-associated protein